jgi:hypothetical protein
MAKMRWENVNKFNNGYINSRTEGEFKDKADKWLEKNWRRTIKRILALPFPAMGRVNQVLLPSGGKLTFKNL